ncbi:MAG TPA: hypothetical protein VM345_03735 [Acidimicrobiales bacterium]|nr:hypothetical protein [Acidimicrobiales bacterium]
MPRTYRFYGLTEAGARELSEALNEDGMIAAALPPGSRPLAGWVVEADGTEDRSEGLLEMLAGFYGGTYEGEDLAGA